MLALELKVPPPAVALIAGLLMWLVSRALPALAYMFSPHNTAAIGLAIIGVATAIAGVVTFRRAKTTVNPLKPQNASSLVASGIYSITRNPMYLGLLLGLTGWATHLSNAVAFLFLPAFVAYINRFQIMPEERALTSLFGKDFTAYRSRVRRWI